MGGKLQRLAVQRRASELIVLILLVAGFVPGAVYGESLGTWKSTTPLPTPVGLESCITNSPFGYVFCVGGETSTVYSTYTGVVQYGNLSNTGGVSSWAKTTSYPLSIADSSCVTYALSIICVGGYNGSARVNGVHSAPILSSGLGNWSTLPAYPTAIELESCVTSSGYIYCFGGYNGTTNSGMVNYGQLTKAGGLASWSQGATYPIAVNSLSCAAYSGYVYCVGGEGSSGSYGDVYYAPLLGASGVGSWSKTTSYPAKVYAHSCAADSAYIYCVGGYAGSAYTNSTYYAPLSSAGVGPWTRSTAFPTQIGEQSCLVYSEALYCFGGYYNFAISSSVYYDPITPTPPTTVTSTTTATVTTTSTVESVVTSTVSSVSTSTPPAQTVTSTTTSFLTSVRTTVVTSTFQSFSLATTTLTSTTVQTSTVTGATSTQAAAPATYSWSVAVPAVGGIVIGFAIALLLTRFRGRRLPSEAQPGPEPGRVQENGPPGG